MKPTSKRLFSTDHWEREDLQVAKGGQKFLVYERGLTWVSQIRTQYRRYQEQSNVKMALSLSLSYYIASAEPPILLTSLTFARVTAKKLFETNHEALQFHHLCLVARPRNLLAHPSWPFGKPYQLPAPNKAFLRRGLPIAFSGWPGPHGLQSDRSQRQFLSKPEP